MGAQQGVVALCPGLPGAVQVIPVEASGTGAASSTFSQLWKAPARRLCALEIPPGRS
jgi:hypothetical protein